MLKLSDLRIQGALIDSIITSALITQTMNYISTAHLLSIILLQLMASYLPPIAPILPHIY